MNTSRMVSDAELLEMLDRGETLSTPERAVLLAYAADRDLNFDVGTLPLGARDRLILSLRVQLFGETIEVCDTCPHCHEDASFDLSCATLDQAGASGDKTAIDVRVGEYEVQCQPPSSADMMAVVRSTDRQAARDALLDATIVRASRGGDPVTATTLPPDVIHEIARRVAEVDALAEISLRVTCEACAGSWDTILELSEFVWQELRDWGHRLLWEVHVIAGAYGWPEREILTVPPGRRQVYLGLVLGA